MPKRCAKFVSQYLIPSLNTQRFGKHLKWIDKKNAIFELDWCHKAGPTWTKEEAEVFVEWDKIKGHYEPDDKQYYTKSKQRFRALLYKLTLEGQIIKLKSTDKYKKIYSIGQKKLMKRRGKKKSSTGDSSCSNDEIYDEKDEFTDEMSWKETSYDKFQANELIDHNYSSLSNSSTNPSDSEDQTSVQENESPGTIFLYGLSESLERKGLVERNYLHTADDMFLDEDLRNSTVGKHEDLLCQSMYDLPSLTKNIYENLLTFETVEPSEANSKNEPPFIWDNFLVDDLHLLC